jgi:hypothetical protein
MAESINEQTRGTDAGHQRDQEGKSSDSQSDVSSTREKNLDQTIADSFPASDPPSTDPNPKGAA